MISKSKLIVLFTVFVMVLSISCPVLAEESGEGGDNKQTPVQVIVQIVVTAVVLRLLDKFDVP